MCSTPAWFACLRWRDLQHSSLTTHFSVSSVLSWHSEPSSGYCLTYRSLDLIPIPQEALQADQLIHSDIMHVDGSVGDETAQTTKKTKAQLRHRQRLQPGSLPVACVLEFQPDSFSLEPPTTSSKQMADTYIKTSSAWQFNSWQVQENCEIICYVNIMLEIRTMGPLNHWAQPLLMDHLGGGD